MTLCISENRGEADARTRNGRNRHLYLHTLLAERGGEWRTLPVGVPVITHWEGVTRSSRTWSSVVVRQETCPFPSDSCLAGAIHTKGKWSNGQQRRVAAAA